MSTATDMRDRYLAAETAILSGQTVRWGDRLITLSNLTEIQNGRREWERRVAAETRQVQGNYGPRYQAADFSGCDE